jgi:Putative zinc-finger
VPDHPDSEQLAAFQAGDGDRRQRAEVEAHLAGCPSCAEVVASVDQARAQLALLEEPDLPVGLHDRLAAAVDAEAAASGVADGTRSRFRRPALVPGRSGPEGNGEPPACRVGAGQRRGRPAPWYRRPIAWGAAAALLLAALVAVPLLDQSSDVTTAGGAQAAREADTGATGAVPLLRIPGEVSAATVRSRLATDRQARAALDSATARRGPGGAGDAAATRGGAGVGADPAPSLGTPCPAAEAAVPQAQNPATPSQSATTPAAPSQDLSKGAGRSTASARPPATAPAALAPCLTAATAATIDPATLPLTPAFYVEGTYQGRPATILVTTSGGQPGRVDLWAFPRDDCSSQPPATERVR